MNISDYLIFIFFSLFHYLIIIISADSRCPESFQCGDLGTLQFPLYHDSNPGCGLFTVSHCNNSETPRIQFGPGSSWFGIVDSISTNKFLIRDPVLHKRLLNNDSCFPLKNLSLPQSPFTSFIVSFNLTIFLCDNRLRIPDYLNSYSRTDNCSFFTAYYNRSDWAADSVLSAEKSGVIPPECQIIQLPRKPYINFHGELYNDLLSAEFLLEWDLSKPCQECHRRGGQCLTNNMNEFFCQKGSSSKRFFLIGGVAASCVSFTFLILFLLIRRRLIPFKFGRFQDRNPENGKGIERFLRNNGILGPRRFR